MKKQILTLAMCLAVSATSVLAAESAKPVKTTAAKSSTCVAKTVEPQKFKSPEEAKKFFEAKMAQRREAFYQELGFSADQKAKAEALDAKTKTDVEAIHKKYRAEKLKLAEDSKKAFENILTKEQKTKFEAMDKERKAKMEKMRKEHKNGEFRNMPPKGPGCPPPEGPEPMRHPED